MHSNMLSNPNVERFVITGFFIIGFGDIAPKININTSQIKQFQQILKVIFSHMLSIQVDPIEMRLHNLQTVASNQSFSKKNVLLFNIQKFSSETEKT